MEALQPQPRKGRGAVSNKSGRYEALKRAAFDDGWDSPETDDPEPLRTEVLFDNSRSIIARNSSPDIPFDQSINPYKGCEHGCIYCFARPTHAWLGLSPGLDFESRIFAKPDAATLLRQELAAKTYRPKVIGLGTNTDPYQPLERRLRITRSVLEVLCETRHPVTIVTKSNLILRDLDILEELANRDLVRVMVSVTTLERALARKMEPRVPTPARRLEAIARLNQTGIKAGVLAAPMIPAINDGELESILEAAAEAGAKTAGYLLVRLPLEIKALFEEWLAAHFPDRRTRVLNLIRGTRGGRLYDSTWGLRMRGQGPYAELLRRRFKLACARLALQKGDWNPDSGQFRPPPTDRRQLTLL